MTNIGFPGLGINFTINKVAIPLPFLGGGIRWYAIILVLGIIVAAYICEREMKRLGETPDNLYNMVMIGLPVSIIGARAYYVLFSLDEYKDNLVKVFAIWEGGIAIYGAVISAFLVCLIYCRVKKLNPLRYFDIAAYGFMIGQAIGRWGNFVNGEAYGVPTDLPWRMSVNGVLAHPTFLYESLFTFAGFLYIWLTRKKRGFDGRAISLYLIWYGTGRFFIEGLRIDSLMLGNMRVSQALSVFLVIGGVILFFWCKGRTKYDV